MKSHYDFFFSQRPIYDKNPIDKIYIYYKFLLTKTPSFMTILFMEVPVV